MYNPPNRLAALLWQMQAQQQPQNMLLAAAEDGFDPDGPVARMLKAQRAAEAAKAAQQMQKNPPAAGRPQAPIGAETPQQTLQRRLRDAGVE